MESYKKSEEQVFHWLMNKHKQDPNFTFSLREKASEGAKSDYFIGTKKINEFSTSFWLIPTELFDNLISFVINLKENGYVYRIQFYERRKTRDKQNEYALKFIQRLKEKLKNFRGFYKNEENKTTEYFHVGDARKEYKSIEDLLKEANIDLMNLIPIIDEELLIFKNNNPNFKAEKITPEQFDKLLDKLNKRREKYADLSLEGDDKQTVDKKDKTDSTSSNNMTTNAPLNQILFGPPGTGKTYHTINKAIEIINPAFDTNQSRDIVKKEFERLVKVGQIVFSTFHQNMSYEDFIEGLKPETDENHQVIYNVKPGVFKQLCEQAALSLSSDLNYVLIIDEINRGNVSQIFGELITLIEEDKRKGKPEALEVTLPYSKEKFSVPSNLYIIGTMNTADRSVEALDAALRRRFNFEEMPAKPEIIKTEGKAVGGMIDGIDLAKVLTTINNRIEILLDKDHQIGHSYFLCVSNEEELKTAFKHKILPLLQEYFFGDYGKIGLVLGKGFISKSKTNQDNSTLFADFDNATDLSSDFEDKIIYEINPINENFDISSAIESLLND